MIIGDGAEYVAKSKEKFDLILCDSSDPCGPNEVLFSSQFYENCASLLGEEGFLFVNQALI